MSLTAIVSTLQRSISLMVAELIVGRCIPFFTIRR